MKTTITYSADFDLEIRNFTDDLIVFDFGEGSLEEALTFAKLIFDNEYPLINGNEVASIFIVDAETAEIYAECTGENPEEDGVPEEYDYEMGFNPYLGCYDDDC